MVTLTLYFMVKQQNRVITAVLLQLAPQQVHTFLLIPSLKKRQAFTGEQLSIGQKYTLEVRCNNISFMNYALSANFRYTLSWTVLFIV